MIDHRNTTTLFIFITNNCNLKCSGCMQSCDRIIDPYYMTIQELDSYLKILKKNHFTVNNLPIGTIHLTGGDPLTHPQIIKFCEMIHQALPNFTIDISTNGLFLNKITDAQLKYLNNEYKVNFQLSLYPTLSLLKMYENIIERFKRLGIHFTFGGGSHFYFSKQEKTTPYPNEYRDYNESCKNMLANQDHAILYKGKIYSCWKDINLLQRENHPKDDAIDLFSDTLPIELIQNKKHYYCDICKCHNGAGGEEFMLWHHHYKNADLIFNNNFRTLFTDYYEIYYELQYNCKNAKEILQNKLFQEYLPENQKRYANTRFLNGKGDIFIPFKKIISEQIKNYLEQIPDIIKYNLYFVSINNDKCIEEQVYNTFIPYDSSSQLNNYFLRANNMVSAYKVFIDNSNLTNKFMFDIDTGEIIELK